MVESTVAEQIEQSPLAVLIATDAGGKIRAAIGGGLRLVGLTPQALAGKPVAILGPAVEAWHQAAAGGHHGSEVTAADIQATHQIAKRAHAVTWGPFYVENGTAPAGALILAIDVTAIEQSKLTAILAKLEALEGKVLPLIQSIAESELDALAARADQLQADEHRRLTVQAVGKWLADRAGYAVTIALTAIAFWIASQLGVLHLFDLAIAVDAPPPIEAPSTAPSPPAAIPAEG